LGVVSVLLIGCGGGGEDQPTENRPVGIREVHVVTDSYEGPENLGVLMANDQGYFSELGLSVEVTSPIAPNRPVEYVSSGYIDLGVAHLPQVVLEKAKGAPIVAFGSLVPQTTAAMIWLEKSGIRKIADLKGKTVAFPGVAFQKGFLESALAQGGLTLDDVKVEDVGSQLAPALVSGRADAIFGGSGNVEGAELESRGLGPVITPVEELGIPNYDELVLIARPDRVSREPQLIRDFLAAVAEGTGAAVDDPEGAVELLEYSGEADRELSRKEREAEVEATLPLLSEDGYIDPEQTDQLVDWMHEEGLIQRKLPVSDLITNDYLPER
jgi:putative hydroxymethylpyrimidine transport system substrate-binding protein